MVGTAVGVLVVVVSLVFGDVEAVGVVGGVAVVSLVFGYVEVSGVAWVVVRVVGLDGVVMEETTAFSELDAAEPDVVGFGVAELEAARLGMEVSGLCAIMGLHTCSEPVEGAGLDVGGVTRGIARSPLATTPSDLIFLVGGGVFSASSFCNIKL